MILISLPLSLVSLAALCRLLAIRSRRSGVRQAFGREGMAVGQRSGRRLNLGSGVRKRGKAEMGGAVRPDRAATVGSLFKSLQRKVLVTGRH